MIEIRHTGDALLALNNLKNVLNCWKLFQELVKHVPKTHLMSEVEWRGLGVQQSQVHLPWHAQGFLF